MPPVTTTDLLLTLDAPAAGGSTMIQNIVLMVAALGIGYFFFVRPAQQEGKAKEALASSLVAGDKVVTASGMHGVIAEVKAETVLVAVGDNKVRIEFEKSSILSRNDSATA
ncbi:MAG: preprotein translocase subunit YajC [Myxococcota bacterium]|jgi:preprotein translocase subunit YajC